MNCIKNLYSSDLEHVREIIKSPPLGTHGFIKNLESHFSFLTESNIKEKLTAISDIETNISYRSEQNEEIPKIIHRVWLNSDQSVVPEEKFLSTVEATSIKLGSDWKTYFWVNNKDTLVALSKRYYNNDTIVVRHINEIRDSLRLLNNIDKLTRDGKLAFACDQLRLELVYIFGGIYCDLGVHFKEDITPILSGRDYVLLMGNSLFFQNSLFGAPKNNPLIKSIVNINERTESFPLKIIGKIDAISESYLASGLMLTMMYIMLTPDFVKPLMLCGNKGIIQWGSQRTWYQRDKSDKSGSVIAKDSQTSLIYNNHKESICIVSFP